MRIWLDRVTMPANSDWVSFGRVADGARQARVGEIADDTPTLAEVSAPDDVARNDRAAAYFVPPGRALHRELLVALTGTERDVLVAVNGLGARGIALLREMLPEARRVLTYRAGEAAGAVLFEQLAWLAQQPERFAVAVSQSEQLSAAALAGANAAITPNLETVDLNGLDRMLAARAMGAVRPTAPAEIDDLTGRECCLTVSRDMTAGEVIDEADLTVDVTAYRGLAPTMKYAVVGRTLRYAIVPGDAIHFGLLK